MKVFATALGFWFSACIAGCGAVYRYPDSEKEDTSAACRNGIDDDLDGRTDCLDPDCASFCREHDASACADGKDNDVDGLTDCDDSDCATFCPEQGAVACADGIDNDLDGKRDCEDDGCAEYCQESSAKACADGIDNDLDGKRDCEDDDCAAFDFCREASKAHCSDGIDNDLDGTVDCADSDCHRFDFCREDSAKTCADGIDNDLDGKRDCDDADCKSWCLEHDAKTCADGVDNDQDGHIDCDDPSCDGFCSESEPGPCSDGRDNDGDGLTDAADPRCWPFSPPVLTRCATFAAQDIEANFDDGGPIDFVSFGSETAFPARTPQLTTRSDGTFGTLGTAGGENSGLDFANLSGVASSARVTGGWPGFELAFSERVLTGTKLAVALVPAELVADGVNPPVGPDSSIVAVTLDGSAATPSVALDVEGQHVTLPLTLPGTCGGMFCNDGWGSVRLALDDSGFTLTVTSPVSSDGSDTKTLKAAALATDRIPTSRLVIWGGGPQDDLSRSLLDDLVFRHGSLSPCGVAVPQIPDSTLPCPTSFPANLAALGGTLSVAQAEDGSRCALVTAGDATTTEFSRVLAFRSTDALSWTSGKSFDKPAEIALPANARLTGAAVARDAGADQWLAVWGQRTDQGVELGLSTSDDCQTWTRATAGPLLPADAEAPSYVVSSDGQAIYFTRPPTEQTLRTLWRASGPTADALELEPNPLYEIPSDARAIPPFSLQRIGASDLVLSFPTQSFSGPPGAALLVSDSSGKSWQPLPAPVLAIGDEAAAAFDGNGVAAAALSFDETGGVLLYSGRRRDAGNARVSLAVGMAAVFSAGVSSTLSATTTAPRCGDGTCDAGEDGESCPADCDSSSLTLASAPLSDATGWTVRSASGAYNDIYVDAQHAELGYSGAPIWAYLPLPTPAPPDFELSFDLTNPQGNLAVGLGADPEPVTLGSYVPTPGVFALFSSFGCSPLIAPFVATRGAPGWQERSCDAGAAGTLPFPAFETRRRVTLRRERGQVSVSVSDDPSTSVMAVDFGNACNAAATLQASGSPGSLDAILIEANGTGAVRNLRLRRLEAPDACPDGETSCGEGAAAICVDTSATPEHCGACFSACETPTICSNGSCQCDSGLAFCEHVCVDVNTALSDCGGCGRVCRGSCVDGACLGGSCAHPQPFKTSQEQLLTLDPAQPLDPNDTPPCGIPLTSEAAFSWTAPASGTAVIQAQVLVSGPGAPLTMGIAAGSSCASYLACTPTPDNPYPTVTASVTAGATYTVVVGATVSQSLSVQLGIFME